MNKYTERLYNGIWKENPIFVQMLGLCPTLAVTTSAMNGLGMGLSSTVVLVAANFIISLMRSIIPGRVRLPGEIVVVASLVTIVDMLMEGFTPDLYSALGIYIRCKLCNLRPCRGICYEEQTDHLRIRRSRHGSWIYLRPCLYRCCP